MKNILDEQVNAIAINLASDYLSGRAPLPPTADVNPAEILALQGGAEAKNRIEQDLIRIIEEPRRQTLQLQVPTEQAEQVRDVGIQTATAAKDDFAQSDTELKTEKRDADNRIRAIEVGTGGIRSAPEIRGKKMIEAGQLGCVEAGITGMAALATGALEGGFLGNVGLVAIAPGGVVIGGIIFGDVCLRNMMDSSKPRLVRFINAVAAAVIGVAAYVLLDQFTNFRSTLDNPPAFVKTGLQLLGCLIFFITALKFYRAPAPNDELKALYKRKKVIDQERAGLFENTLTQNEAAIGEAHERLEILLASTEPQVEGIYLSVQDIEHACASYEGELARERGGYERVISDARAIICNAVNDRSIPAYLNQKPSLAAEFESNFDFDAFVKHAEGLVQSYQELKTDAAKFHKELNAKQTELHNAIIAIRKSEPVPVVRALPNQPIVEEQDYAL